MNYAAYSTVGTTTTSGYSFDHQFSSLEEQPIDYSDDAFRFRRSSSSLASPQICDYFESDEYKQQQLESLLAQNLTDGLQSRGALNSKSWPGDLDGVKTRKHLVIPFRHDPTAEHTTTAKKVIQESFDEITKELNGCIKFQDDSSQKKFSYWINIWNKASYGCSANVGYLGSYSNYKVKGQILNLSPSGCLVNYIINHEMLHALAFNHEQERPDRNKYVKVHFDRIASSKKHNFEIIKAADWFDMGIPYDIQSVMHYSAFAFQTSDAATKRLPTITDLKGNPVQWPRTRRLSSMDLIQLGKKYESYCGKPGGQFIKTKKCKDGQDYLANRYCDGINDCIDGSDEDAKTCQAYCEADTIEISKGGSTTSEKWTGKYQKIKSSGYPKSIKITHKGGEVAPLYGFSGIHLALPLKDSCFFSPKVPMYKMIDSNRYIYFRQFSDGTSRWYHSTIPCQMSLGVYYMFDPAKNGGKKNIWDLPNPVMSRYDTWQKKWFHDYKNVHTQVGSDGWKALKSNHVLSMRDNGRWEISETGSSAKVTLSRMYHKFCVVGEYDGEIKVSSKPTTPPNPVITGAKTEVICTEKTMTIKAHVLSLFPKLPKAQWPSVQLKIGSCSFSTAPINGEFKQTIDISKCAASYSQDTKVIKTTWRVVGTKPAQSSGILLDKIAHIDATCEYLSALNLMSDAYKVNQNGPIVVTDPQTGGAGKPVSLSGVFNVKMTGISNVHVQIGGEMKSAVTTDFKFGIPYDYQINSCTVYDSSAKTGKKYAILQNPCKPSVAVKFDNSKLVGNISDPPKFGFTSFTFDQKDTTLYLECSLNLCLKDPSTGAYLKSSCITKCT